MIFINYIFILATLFLGSFHSIALSMTSSDESWDYSSESEEASDVSSPSNDNGKENQSDAWNIDEDESCDYSSSSDDNGSDSDCEDDVLSEKLPNDSKSFVFNKQVTNPTNSAALISSENYKSAMRILINSLNKFITHNKKNNDLGTAFTSLREIFNQTNLTLITGNPFIDEEQLSNLNKDIFALFNSNKTVMELCKHISSKNLQFAEETQASFLTMLQKTHTVLCDYIQSKTQDFTNRSISDNVVKKIFFFVKDLEKNISQLCIFKNDKLQGFIALEHIGLPDFSHNGRKVTGGHLHQESTAIEHVKLPDFKHNGKKVIGGYIYEESYASLWDNPQDNKPRVYGFMIVDENKQGQKIGYWMCTEPSFPQEPINYYKLSTLFADNEFDTIWEKAKHISIHDEEKVSEMSEIFAQKAKLPFSEGGLALSLKSDTDDESIFKLPMRSKNGDNGTIDIPTIYPLFVKDFANLKFVYNSTEKSLSLIDCEDKKCIFVSKITDAFCIKYRTRDNQELCHRDFIYESCGMNYEKEQTLPLIKRIIANTKNQSIKPSITEKYLSACDCNHLLRQLNNGYYFLIYNVSNDKVESNCCIAEIAECTYVKIHLV